MQIVLQIAGEVIPPPVFSKGFTVTEVCAVLHFNFFFTINGNKFMNLILINRPLIPPSKQAGTQFFFDLIKKMKLPLPENQQDFQSPGYSKFS